VSQQPYQYGQPQFGQPQKGQPQNGQLLYGQQQRWRQPALAQARMGSSFGAPTGLPRYGPGPAQPARPPRRGGPLRLVLIGLILVTVLALGALVLIGLLGSGSSEGPYKNNDYQVPPADLNPPPLPQPTSVAEATQWVTSSAFYGQSVPAPVRCSSTPINVGTASDEQLKAHFEGLMECLVRAWEPPVTGAGFTIVRPSVTIYADTITTKCGESGVNAFYCSIDQQTYYSNQIAKAVPIIAEDKWAADVVMAHEFGHAAQARTGLLTSVYVLRSNAESEAANLNVARRKELQADCFAGMSVRSLSRALRVAQADAAGIMATFQALGDDTLTCDPNVVGDHGHSASRRFWAATGIGNSSVGACNTFTAPDGQIQ
jgi:uncharacterized protein